MHARIILSCSLAWPNKLDSACVHSNKCTSFFCQMMWQFEIRSCQNCKTWSAAPSGLSIPRFSISTRQDSKEAARLPKTDFSDFLGRIHPRQTRLQKPPDALGVEESSSPRRVLLLLLSNSSGGRFLKKKHVCEQVVNCEYNSTYD